MNIFRPLALYTLAAITWTAAHAVGAEPLPAPISELQHGWARAYYTVPDAEKNPAFEELESRAAEAVAASPGRAEPLVWQAIIQSSHAKFAGGLAALDLIKQARDHLLEAEKIEPAVLDGSVYTSLGSLYAKAPGWPLSFGDRKKARAYLEHALAINPDGIDPNFFYGELLVSQGDKEAGRVRLQKALAAPPRPGREDADAGRRAEIQAALAKLR